MRALAMKLVLAVMCSALCVAHAQTRQPERPRYLDTALSESDRGDDLISRMTLEEKASQMVHSARAIPRLGIPAYNWWSEGLHGVAVAGTATVFPQAIGLAATWDDPLLNRVADVISTEARAKHHDAVRHGNFGMGYGLTFWSPNINIFRDPRWGRGQETYGEDPYLTSRMAVAFVRGLQGDDSKYLKTVSTPKHFAVHSGPEPLRHYFDAKTTPRDMEDLYLPAFRAAVREGNAGSVMCAYNRVNGAPACANDFLLKTTLRDNWGFDGYVVSDCAAEIDIHTNHEYVKTEEEAVAAAIKSGTDLECWMGQQAWNTQLDPEYMRIVRAVQQGLISEEDVNRSLKRLLVARIRLGMFDPPEQVAYARIPISENDTEAHRQFALQAARESLVLLKNQGDLLPLDPAKIKRIAVIGPYADNEEVLRGNYNGVPSRSTTYLAGLRKRFPGAQVTYDKGVLLRDEALTIPSSMFALGPDRRAGTGLKAEFFVDTQLEGKPVLTRTDPVVDFKFDQSPSPQLDRLTWSARWTGQLIPQVTGEYLLGAATDDGLRLYLDGKLFVEDWRKRAAKPMMRAVHLEAGKRYDIRLEYNQTGGGAEARLVWVPPTLTRGSEALEAARQADVTVMVLGISASLEGEEMDVNIPGFRGGDRTSIDLPQDQQRLLEAVQTTGKPVVLVLTSGSALAVNWADAHVPAIVQSWYAGEEGGTAVAEMLAGDFSPAGRLPVTFYKSVDQLPPFEDYRVEGRTYRYFKGEPLYPFGYGLSYTNFSYKNAIAEPGQNGGVRVHAEITNSGSRDGDEVVQVYLSKDKSQYRVPIRWLAAFERIHLKAGASRTVSFLLKPEQLMVINDAGIRVAEGGEFRISVGGGQPTARLHAGNHAETRFDWSTSAK